jgi:hypothetical protein
MDLDAKKPLDYENQFENEAQKRRISASNAKNVLAFWAKFGRQKKNHH